MTRRTLTSVPTPDDIRHDRDTVASALAELAAGRMVLVVDDEDRENEGDLICAAETATPEALAFMIRHTTGLVCVALPDERADVLELPLMVAHGDDPNGTAFTITVDLKNVTTTGVSAADRAATIRAFADAGTRPGDLSRPGHILPLRARPGGVLERRGTEAASDLCRLAGLEPIGVLCEITNDDGTMARVPELSRFANEHDLVTISVADLVEHRRAAETNNPDKHRQLAAAGVQVERCDPIVTEVHPEDDSYLATKSERMDHDLGGPVPATGVLERVG